MVGRGGESARSYKTFLARHFLWLCCYIYTLARRIQTFYSVLGILRTERMPSCRRWRLVVCKSGRSANKFRISQIRRFYYICGHFTNVTNEDLRFADPIFGVICNLKTPPSPQIHIFCFYKYMKHIKYCFETYLCSVLWKFADL